MEQRILPAYPLFVKDPYYSVWVRGDKLNETDASFWTGKKLRTYGVISANNHTYCFLGNLKNIGKLEQTDIAVSAFRTSYQFECSDFRLEVAFFSPLPVSDLTIWACPVCYLEYKIIPHKELRNVSVSLSLHEEWCYQGQGNTKVRGDVMAENGFEVAYFGLSRQHILNQSGDQIGASWGYYYLAAQRCFYHTIDDFSDVAAKDYCTEGEEEARYITGQNFCPSVKEPVTGKIAVAFDDVVSVNYFGRMMQGYYFADGKNILDAILFSERDYEKICSVCAETEEKLRADALVFGEKYLCLLNAAYRQTVAAHKLIKDANGRILLLSKECGSGGCAATVDVTYPTMPFFLLYNPELVRASIEPVFDFAKTDAWEYEFAPHDVGVYPYCTGQFYGVKNKAQGRFAREIEYQPSEYGKQVLPSYYFYPKGAGLYNLDRQMPVEECADMVLICAFYLACGGDKEYVRGKLDFLTKWCDYLVGKSLIPENQLCTDDFLNHMDKNVNLAVKSVAAIAAFAKVLEKLGMDGQKYAEVAAQRAKEMSDMFSDTHMPLAFGDGAETFSMKYNLMPVKLLGLDLFSQDVFKRELDVCLAHRHRFGFPLDNRSNLTKSDWMMWMAALSDDAGEQETIIGGIVDFMKETSDRMPFPDLYDCETGTVEKFTNRTVQGSMFVLLLKNKMNCK